MASAFKRTALALATGLLFFSGCGKESSKPDPTPPGAPVAGSGRGVLSGVVSIVSGNCNTTAGILVMVDTLAGNNIYTYLAPVGTSYEAQLTPGEYTLTCQATPCTFSQRFTLTSGQSLVIDPVM